MANWIQDSLIEIEDDGCGNADGGEEGMCAAVVTRGDPAPALEPPKHVLDLCLLPVESLVVFDLDLAIPFCRYAGRYASGTQRCPEPGSVIAAVCDQGSGFGQCGFLQLITVFIMGKMLP